jgi:hypothetical protein
MPKADKNSHSDRSVVPQLFDRWFRASDCFIEADDIVATGPVMGYSPASISNLTEEFGGIVDEVDALRFVTEYGPPELPEGVSRVDLSMGRASMQWRRPVKSILKQAGKVAGMRKVAALLTDTRPEIQKNLTARLTDAWPIPPAFRARMKDFSPAQEKHSFGEFILTELNTRLRRSCELAHVNVRGEFDSVLSFESLLDVIYRRIFEELKRGKLRSCHECEAVFEWADPRQMYCSKRCGLNLAQKRYRQRKTEEGHESPATPGRS